MTRKSKFLNKLDKFGEEIETNNQKLNDILKNDNYADEYKNEAKNVAGIAKKQIGVDTSTELINILDEAITEYKNSIDKANHERMTSQGYQLGLQNLINAIGNDALSNDDLQSLYEIYKDDVIAIKSINSAIAKSNKSIASLPIPNLEKTENLLNKLKSNVSTYVDNPNHNTDLFIIGTKEFINNHLDDNMFSIDD